MPSLPGGFCTNIMFSTLPNNQGELDQKRDCWIGECSPAYACTKGLDTRYVVEVEIQVLEVAQCAPVGRYESTKVIIREREHA